MVLPVNQRRQRAVSEVAKFAGAYGYIPQIVYVMGVFPVFATVEQMRVFNDSVNKEGYGELRLPNTCINVEMPAVSYSEGELVTLMNMAHAIANGSEGTDIKIKKMKFHAEFLPYEYSNQLVPDSTVLLRLTEDREALLVAIAERKKALAA